MNYDKNNYIKAVTGLGLLISVALTPSCKKSFLDVPAQGQQESTVFWKTPEDAAKGVNAIYGNLRSWENTAFPAIAIENIGSDDADKGSTASDASFFLQFDRFTIDPDQGNSDAAGFYEHDVYWQLIPDLDALVIGSELRTF